jgi:hypothetical protein
VSPALRGVTVGQRRHTVVVRSYFDGEISDDDADSIWCEGAEIIADFIEPWVIDEQVIRLDAPQRMARLEAWAYLRQEPGARAPAPPGYRLSLRGEVSGTGLLYHARLAAPWALLRAVTPELRRVTIRWEERAIDLRTYFHGPAMADGLRLAQRLQRKIAGEFPADWAV